MRYISTQYITLFYTHDLIIGDPSRDYIEACFYNHDNATTSLTVRIDKEKATYTIDYLKYTSDDEPRTPAVKVYTGPAGAEALKDEWGPVRWLPQDRLTEEGGEETT